MGLLGTGRRLRWLSSAAILVAAVLAGCGGDDETPDGRVTPSVVGQDENKARATIREGGLRVASRYVLSNAPEGTVFQQSPRPGKELDEGSTVKIRISQGRGVRIPNVLGATTTDAKPAVTETGLDVVFTPRSPGGASCTVDDQNPPGGVRVERGALIELSITCLVPDVVGMSGGLAVSRLRAGGFTIGGVSNCWVRQQRTIEDECTIRAQDPTGEADPRQSVDLKVTAPPPPPPPPRCEKSYPDVCLDPNALDYDCLGGTGDGPLYVAGPIRVRGLDPFDLDRNSDGIGCETD